MNPTCTYLQSYMYYMAIWFSNEKCHGKLAFNFHAILTCTFVICHYMKSVYFYKPSISLYILLPTSCCAFDRKALLPRANDVCEGYVFTGVCHSVHGEGGGIPACLAGLWGRGGIPACLAGLQAHTQGRSWGVWPGGSPGPHPGGSWGVWPEGVSRPTPGGSPACTEADIPHPSRRLLLRAVRILLECILVVNIILVITSSRRLMYQYLRSISGLLEVSWPAMHSLEIR